MTPQQADQAIQQVQNAHRLVVAYYQRMLQTLEAIAHQQNCSFHWWGSQYFAQPCRGSTDPLSKGSWDFVPLLAPRIIYSRCQQETELNDVIIEFIVISDLALSPESRQKNKIKGEPDPLNLNNEGSILEAYIYRPLDASKQSFIEAYQESEYPEKTGRFKNVGKNIKCLYLSWPLPDLLHNRDEIEKKIAKYCA